MPRRLACPTCNASLPRTATPGQAVTCEYCGNHVVVPGEPPLAPAPPTFHDHGPAVGVGTAPQGVPVDVGQVARRGAGGCLGVAVVLLLLVVGGIGVAVFVVGDAVQDGLDGLGDVVDVDGALADGGPAPELVVGAAGTGVGRFDDAREVGVDAEGFIYVGEFASRRIQRFTRDGEVSGQWVVDGQQTVPLTGMAVARDGTVLVQVGFEVHRYRGATGELLGQVTVESASPFDWFDAVAALPDGGVLLVERDGVQPHLVWLDAQGAEVRRVTPTELASPTTVSRVAVDGQGRIHVLGNRVQSADGPQTGVFAFDAQGTFQDFFGVDDGGGSTLATGLAVDGRGDVHVAGPGGVQRFDRDGRVLDRLAVSPTPYGLAADDEGLLWVVLGDEVRAYRLEG